MDRITAIMILCLSCSAASYAQDTKQHTQPAYDNINQERQRQNLSPGNNGTSAVMEKGSYQPDNKQVNWSKTEVIDIQHHTVSDAPKDVPMKKVFPKRQPGQ